MGLFTFPAGEESKSLATAAVLCEWLAKCRAERGDVIVAVGGGARRRPSRAMSRRPSCAAFASCRYPHLAHGDGDSAIGGKTGVDLPAAKNMVGAFHHPAMVLADVSALRTLPERALREGWAEAIKHGFALEAPLVGLLRAQRRRAARSRPRSDDRGPSRATPPSRRELSAPTSARRAACAAC